MVRESAGILRDSVLQSILLIVFVGIVGIQAAPPALSSIGQTMGVPDGQLGLVMTAFFLPAALALPVVGFTADAYGRRPVAIGALVMYGLAGLAAALAQEFSVLLLLRALQGFAFPGLIPLSITLAGDFYTGEQGSLVQGLRVSINGIASTVTPALAGILAGIAWYYPFWLSASALPVAGFVYIFLPEPAQSDTNSHSGIAYLLTYVRAIGSALRDPALVVLLGAAFVSYFSRYALYTFLPLYAVRVLNASTATGGLLLSVIGVARILAPLLTGSAIRLTSRKRTLLSMLGVAAVSLAVIPLVGDVWVVAGVVSVYGIAMSLFLPVLNDSVSLMAPSEYRAGVVNTMELGKTAALGLSPAIFGIVLSLSNFTLLFGLAGTLLAGYVVFAALILGSETIGTAISQAEQS